MIWEQVQSYDKSYQSCCLNLKVKQWNGLSDVHAQWQGMARWIFSDIFTTISQTANNSWTRASPERCSNVRAWKWRPPFPLYSQCPHAEVLPSNFGLWQPPRVSVALFFSSAIGLVFKRTVEFHVRHRETMSAIFLTNTYLFCNHCINYLMNHVTRRGMGVTLPASSRDHSASVVQTFAFNLNLYEHTT